MRTLLQIEREIQKLEKQKEKNEEEYNQIQKTLQESINEYEKEKWANMYQLDLDKITEAQKHIVIHFSSYYFDKVSLCSEQKDLIDSAIMDLLNDFENLHSTYFGYKQYSYYERCDCKYGYGPKWGSITDSVSLRNPDYNFSEEEKDSILYYLNCIKENRSDFLSKFLKMKER